MRFLTSARVRAVILLSAALTLLAGGVAYAVTTGPIDSSGVIHGCYYPATTGGSHKVVLQDVGKRCPTGTTAITWNQKGPAGPTGPQGPAGPPGPAGPSAAYAKVVNGPVAAPVGSSTVASLDIPVAGDYVISSKMFLTFDQSLFSSVVYECDLQAGTDIDVTRGSTGAEASTPNGPAPVSGLIVNSLVHEFTSPGTVDLSCNLGNPSFLNYITITAIQVGSLTTS